MELKNITTVEELAEFMDTEAAEWGREDSKQKFVNGKGIYQQWGERINFPFAIFYLIGKEGEPSDNPFPRADGVPHVIFEMKSMWFDTDGNKTDRPKRKTDTDKLYRND